MQSPVSYSILNALKECVDGAREGTTPDWHKDFQKDWWSKMIPYFLYACSCGSLNVVKYFAAKGYQPNVRYICIIVLLHTILWLEIIGMYIVLCTIATPFPDFRAKLPSCVLLHLDTKSLSSAVHPSVA